MDEYVVSFIQGTARRATQTKGTRCVPIQFPLLVGNALTAGNIHVGCISAPFALQFPIDASTDVFPTFLYRHAARALPQVLHVGQALVMSRISQGTLRRTVPTKGTRNVPIQFPLGYVKK